MPAGLFLFFKLLMLLLCCTLVIYSWDIELYNPISVILIKLLQCNDIPIMLTLPGMKGAPDASA